MLAHVEFVEEALALGRVIIAAGIQLDRVVVLVVGDDKSTTQISGGILQIGLRIEQAFLRKAASDLSHPDLTARA